MRRTCHFRVCVWLSIFSLNIDNITGKIKINSRGLSVWLMTEDRTLNAEVGMGKSECGMRKQKTRNQGPAASYQLPAASYQQPAAVL
jgi:hypothetical protein